jgi:hypothetical protein
MAVPSLVYDSTWRCNDVPVPTGPAVGDSGRERSNPGTNVFGVAECTNERGRMGTNRHCFDTLNREKYRR